MQTLEEYLEGRIETLESNIRDRKQSGDTTTEIAWIMALNEVKRAHYLFVKLPKERKV